MLYARKLKYIKRWVIFIELTLLNPNMLTKLLHQPQFLRERERERPLESKTTHTHTHIFLYSLPLPEPPEKYTLDSEPESKETSPEARTSTKEEQDFSSYSTTEPHLVTQAELNDLVRDLDFLKIKAQLLGSWLRQCHLLRKECESVFCRKGQSNIAK